MAKVSIEMEKALSESEENTVFCNSCGAEMQPTIRTCPRCGSASGLIGGIRSRMGNSIRSLTTESLLEAILFEVGNRLVNSVGYCESAKEKLASSHPAFSAVTIASEQGESARAFLQEVGEEWRRRKTANRADQ